MKFVVVSGASSGIGEAIALQLAEAGWQVFAGVRSEEDAARPYTQQVGGDTTDTAEGTADGTVTADDRSNTPPDGDEVGVFAGADGAGAGADDGGAGIAAARARAASCVGPAGARSSSSSSCATATSKPVTS